MTGLTSGTTHFYQVRAVNAANTRSAWSNRMSAAVVQRGTPPAPTSVAATFGNQNVTLTWAAPASDGGSPITRYEYRYAESGGTYSVWTGVGLTFTVNVSGLTNGQEYDFEVRAVNGEGDGEAASDSATPATVPLAPNLNATGGYKLITLSWTPPTDNGGAAVTSYILQRRDTNAIYVTLANPAATATTYTDRGLRDNTEYNYQLIAVNPAGNSQSSSDSATTVLTRPSVPSDPLPGDPTFESRPWRSHAQLGTSGVQRPDGDQVRIPL